MPWFKKNNAVSEGKVTNFYKSNYVLALLIMPVFLKIAPPVS
jgi:hypothetical protein